MSADVRVLLSCEHAGNAVPPPWRRAAAIPADVLYSHRGWDPGALDLARVFRRYLKAPLEYTKVSRLIVDANRTIGNPTIFSEYVRLAELGLLDDAVGRYYVPFRSRFHEMAARVLRSGARVVHLSVHTFTPIFDGEVRRADVGLLYDPEREDEVDLCRRWAAGISRCRPELRVRSNEPYQGTDDGHVTELRRRFGRRYLGLELEVNQRFVGEADWASLSLDLAHSFQTAVAAWAAERDFDHDHG